MAGESEAIEPRQMKRQKVNETTTNGPEGVRQEAPSNSNYIAKTLMKNLM